MPSSLHKDSPVVMEEEAGVNAMIVEIDRVAPVIAPDIVALDNEVVPLVLFAVEGLICGDDIEDSFMVMYTGSNDASSCNHSKACI